MKTRGSKKRANWAVTPLGTLLKYSNRVESLLKASPNFCSHDVETPGSS